MSKETNNKSRSDIELLLRVDEVLHYLWDPIGISGVPQARDEYSTYAGGVLSLLKRGAKASDVADYLGKVRRENMEIGPSQHSLSELEVAEVLIDWKDVMEEKSDVEMR